MRRGVAMMCVLIELHVHFVVTKKLYVASRGAHSFFKMDRSGMSSSSKRFSLLLTLPCRAVPQKNNLRAFKEGDVRFLICTDVAARGVDIKGLPYVVNMTLPDEPENYIHRIGRVGRQDCLGLAVSIVACEGCKEKVLRGIPFVNAVARAKVLRLLWRARNTQKRR